MLVPLLCEACRTDSGDPIYPFASQGCAECRHTGYKDVRAISEMLFVDTQLRELIANYAADDGADRLAQHLAASGESLKEQALALARDGYTTPARAIELTTFAK